MQTLDRRLPAVAIDEVVPVGNQIAKRAALMAERNAAVHAARALHLQVARLVRQIDLAPVLDALLHRPRRLLLPLDLDETCRLTHMSLEPRRTRRSRSKNLQVPLRALRA